MEIELETRLSIALIKCRLKLLEFEISIAK